MHGGIGVGDEHPVSGGMTESVGDAAGFRFQVGFGLVAAMDGHHMRMGGGGLVDEAARGVVGPIIHQDDLQRVGRILQGQQRIDASGKVGLLVARAHDHRDRYGLIVLKPVGSAQPPHAGHEEEHERNVHAGPQESGPLERGEVVENAHAR